MYPDIVNYLVFTKSAYTSEELKAYKSLEAYNQVVCGWVRKIATYTLGNNIMHSQRLNEKLLSPWVYTKKEGQVISAHCDCVAGLGECCTHVAALMFAVDDVLRKVETVSSTGTKAYWVAPSSKPSDPSKVVDLNLLPAKRRKETTEEVTEEQPLQKRGAPKYAPLTKENISEILRNLSESTTRGAVLQSVFPAFAEEIAQDRKQNKNFSLMKHFDEENLLLSLSILQQKGDNLNLTLTFEDTKQIEMETRLQSKCKLWFTFRAGRITASNFKRCCKTSIEKPSLSLIKSICYPQNYKLKSKAQHYGCDHEDLALKDFQNKFKENHRNVCVNKLGVFINPNFPWFGASPDALLDCNCCGTALIEIKCPYCAKQSGVECQLEIKKFFLTRKDKEIILLENHAYYYQVQMQLALTMIQSCYLVVWSRKDFIIKKIDFNLSFWESESKKSKLFFNKVLVPEILGKYYTRESDAKSDNILADFTNPLDDVSEDPPSSGTAPPEKDNSLPTIESLEETEPYLPTMLYSEPDLQLFKSNEPIPGPSSIIGEQVYCICQQPDDGKRIMIACANENCDIEWFHLVCVGLKTVPNDLWLCQNCK